MTERTACRPRHRNPARRWLRRFRRDESGTATVEFVILFTPILMMMLAGAEAGLLNLRHVMLERGLDIAVRAVRLGPATPPSSEQIKDLICDQALLIPDCKNSVAVEMTRVSKTTWDLIDPAATCVDKSEAVQPLVQYVPGAPSDLMLIRACMKAQPIFPTTGLAAMLQKDGNGDYAAVAVSAFVNEPV